MSVFDAPDFDNHETVALFSDAESGLRAVIAIHSTALGPALGGCRIWPYASEREAVTDVLRLSRGMTYKAALAGLNFGGGKAVIIADPRAGKTAALLRAFGRAVESLGGRYVTAEDMGSAVADLEIVREETRHVAGIAEGRAGDPSPATAHGVFHGIAAAARHAFGTSDLGGVRVAIQGLGHVGIALGALIHEAGGTLTVADINPRVVEAARQRFGAVITAPDRIHATKADVFAPCALGAVLNDRTIPEIRAGVVAGSANNQLAEPRHGAALRQRGILHAPDYVINAGGIINIAHEGPGYDRQAAFAHVGRIEETLTRVFERADADGIATSLAADHLAEARFKRAA